MSQQYYFYRQKGYLQRIRLAEILYLETIDNYTKFYTAKGEHLIRISLEAALSQLPVDQFIRINRTFAVAIDHVEMVNKDSVAFAEAIVLEFTLSRKYYADFVKKLKIIGG